MIKFIHYLNIITLSFFFSSLFATTEDSSHSLFSISPLASSNSSSKTAPKAIAIPASNSFGTASENSPFEVALYLPDYRLHTQVNNNEISSFARYSPEPNPSRFTTPFLSEKRHLPQSYNENSWEGYLGSKSTTLLWFISSDPKTLPVKENYYKPILTDFFKRIQYWYSTKINLSYLAGHTLFPRWTETQNSISRGVDSVASFLEENGFNGVDLDWEFPKTEEEHQKLVDLVASFKNNPLMYNKTVSVTTAQYRKYNRKVYDLVDYVNLMAYDYDIHHSTLKNATGATEDLIRVMQLPPQKVILGLPFYARGFVKGVNDRKAWGTIKYYSVIDKTYSPKEDKNIITKEESFDNYGYFYNGPSLIEEKTNYALEANLGGVMVWEIFHDTMKKNSLLRSIVKIKEREGY